MISQLGQRLTRACTRLRGVHSVLVGAGQLEVETIEAPQYSERVKKIKTSRRYYIL